MFIDLVETHSKINHCFFAVLTTDLLLHPHPESYDSGEYIFIEERIPTRKHSSQHKEEQSIEMVGQMTGH